MKICHHCKRIYSIKLLGIFVLAMGLCSYIHISLRNRPAEDKSDMVVTFQEQGLTNIDPTSKYYLRVKPSDRVKETLHDNTHTDKLQRIGGKGLPPADVTVTTKLESTKMTDLPPCPLIPPNLSGAINIESLEQFSMEKIEHLYNTTLSRGRHKPSTCVTSHRVAIIVPYRNRKKHLLQFLHHMHFFLQKQQLDYGIFIVELQPEIIFNRALLMNIGYMEAVRSYGYNCFVFHDVDLLPENDWNLYTCSSRSPLHMSVLVDKFDYRLPYQTLFGGVSAMTKNQFQLLNGYSNKYFGWGGEDDDMFNRVNASQMVVLRDMSSVSRYHMLVHEQDKVNPKRRELVYTGLKRWREDGLNSLDYTVLLLKPTVLYTYVLVDINVTNPAFIVDKDDLEMLPVKDAVDTSFVTICIVFSCFIVFCLFFYKYLIHLNFIHKFFRRS